MRKIITETGEKESKKAERDRKEIAEKIIRFEKRAQEGVSQRQVAEELKIPRTTLQHWIKRKENLEAETEVANFFESPAGVVFLHQLVIAAQFVITAVGPGGIRMVCLFLELSGLAKFVGSSYGAQQQVNVAMEKAIVELAELERKRLGAGMKPKKISVCQDETFHPEICLVGIEPVSNFILVEKYANSRDESNWNGAMTAAVEGLAVQIIQSTSDEGKGLLAHVENGLGVHHSPDLFHIESELTKATAAQLASQTREAQKTYQKAVEKTAQCQTQKADYLKQGGGHNVIYFDECIEKAEQMEQVAKQTLGVVQSNQLAVQDAVRGISAAYHPFDLQTGLPRNGQAVASLLADHFAQIQAVANRAHLSAASHKRIQKAHKLIPQMCATITFFFQMCTTFVQQLSLPLAIEELLYQQMIPAFYLQLAASKAKAVEQRNLILATAQRLLAAATSPSSPLNHLEIDHQKQIELLAKDCAQLFQRSSSCVEGRNGQLSLRHHSFHRLSNRKLNVLTAIHNFFIKRVDGSTAAERFFGSPPIDLFYCLLDRIDFPARPAIKRSLLRSVS